MKFNLNIYVCILLISLFVSCSKEKADDTNNGGSNKLRHSGRAVRPRCRLHRLMRWVVLLKQNDCGLGFPFLWEQYISFRHQPLHCFKNQWQLPAYQRQPDHYLQ